MIETVIAGIVSAVTYGLLGYVKSVSKNITEEFEYTQLIRVVIFGVVSALVLTSMGIPITVLNIESMAGNGFVVMVVDYVYKILLHSIRQI